jgi:arabinofuranosyltransferase
MLRTLSPTRARVLGVVLIVIPIVVLIFGAWQYRWMSDDGFINLRVVKQIEAGHGPVFNQGERVEAATSPLWVAILTVADVLLPLRLEWIAVLLGIAATVAGIALVLYGAVKLLPTRAPNAIVLPTGILVLVAFAPVWKFASSGLEEGLFTLWFGASFGLLARWAASDRSLPSLWTAAVVGVGPLIRPDLSLMTFAFLTSAVVVGGDSLGKRTRFVAVALALPIAYQVFRMGYYAALFPNTAFAKEASRSWWSHGFTYVIDAGRPYWLWVPLVTLIVGGYGPLIRAQLREGRRRQLAILIACAAGGCAHLLYVARVGGDFMHARLVLPGLTALIAPVAVTVFSRKLIQVVTSAIIIVWSLVSIAFLRSIDDAPITFIGSPRNGVTLSDYGWQSGGPSFRWFNGPGVYFDGQLVAAPRSVRLPPVVSAEFGVGMSSYALGPDAYVLDMLGLGDAFTSHLRLGRRGVIAHEKPLPRPWVAARLLAPDARVGEADFPLPEFFLARPLDRPDTPFPERVDAARTALTCGRLDELLDDVGDRLSVGVFVRNVFDAFGNSRLRISPEPSDAVEQFCNR